MLISYAVRRILGAIPTLLIIITLAFVMMRIAPGGPFDGERRLPPEVEANVMAAYDLDKPLHEQYFIYLGRLLKGDLGPSFRIRDFTVTELIASGLPVSLRLGLSAITVALLLGTTLGVFAALRQNRPADFSVMAIAMVGITIPTFVTAPLLTLLFGVYGVHLFGLEFTLLVSLHAVGIQEERSFLLIPNRVGNQLGLQFELQTQFLRMRLRRQNQGRQHDADGA